MFVENVSICNLTSENISKKSTWSFLVLSWRYQYFWHLLPYRKVKVMASFSNNHYWSFTFLNPWALELSFKVYGCQTKAQWISEHCIFQKCLRYNKSKKSKKKGPKTPKKIPQNRWIGVKTSYICVFHTKNPKKNCICSFWENSLGTAHQPKLEFIFF